MMALTWELDADGMPFVYEKLPDGTSLHICVRFEDDGDAVPVEIAPGVIQHGDPDGVSGWMADGMMFHENGRLSVRLRSTICEDESAAKDAAESVWKDLYSAARIVPSSIGLPPGVISDIIAAAAAEAREAEAEAETPDNVVPFVGDVEVVTSIITAFLDIADQVPDSIVMFAMQRMAGVVISPEEALGVLAQALQDPDRARWIGQHMVQGVSGRAERWVQRVLRLKAIVDQRQ